MKSINREFISIVYCFKWVQLRGQLMVEMVTTAATVTMETVIMAMGTVTDITGTVIMGTGTEDVPCPASMEVHVPMHAAYVGRDTKAISVGNVSSILRSMFIAKFNYILVTDVICYND